MLCDLALENIEKAIHGQSDVLSLDDYCSLIQSTVHAGIMLRMKREEFPDFDTLMSDITHRKPSKPYKFKDAQKMVSYELQRGMFLCSELRRKFASW